MDKIVEKIEAMLEKQVAEFETNPIRTSLKFLVAAWVIRKVYKWIKEQA